MRMVLLLLLSVFAISSVTPSLVLADQGFVGKSSSFDVDGALKDSSEEKYFIKVRNTSGGIVYNGQVLIWDSAQDDGVSATTTSSVAMNPVCVVAETSCADDKPCKCQTYGRHEGLLFDVTNAEASKDHDIFISENNAGYAQAEALASYAVGDKPIGSFLDDATASGEEEAFIDLR